MRKRYLTEDGYWKNAHSCYLLQYHMVLVTKYRKPVLTGAVKEHVYATICKTLEEKNVRVIEMNGEADHIHILFEASPDLSMTELANVLKTRSARFAWRDLPEEVSKIYWNTGKHLFWSASYFVCTVGVANKDIVQRYIQNQKN